MAGVATALAMVKSAAVLRVAVTALLALAENLPSGTATCGWGCCSLMDMT